MIHQRHRQTDRRTDGRTTYDSNTALALRAWRGKKTEGTDLCTGFQWRYFVHILQPAFEEQCPL